MDTYTLILTVNHGKKILYTYRGVSETRKFNILKIWDKIPDLGKRNGIATVLKNGIVDEQIFYA